MVGPNLGYNSRKKNPNDPANQVATTPPPPPTPVAGAQSGTSVGGKPTFTGTPGVSVAPAAQRGINPADPGNQFYGNQNQGANTVQPDPSTINSGTKGGDDVSNQISAFVSKYGSGTPADTSAQEALVNQQEQQNLGSQLYNQRASLGASGFGASGAAVGLENDARRKAAMDASGAILGIRQQAASDAYNRGLGAFGLDIQERDAATRQAQEDAANKALEALLGGGPSSGGTNNAAAATAATGAGGGFGTSFGDTVDPGRGLHSDTPATAGTPNAPATAPTRVTKDQLPAGSTPDGTEGDITYYKGPDGKEYYVKG